MSSPSVAERKLDVVTVPCALEAAPPAPSADAVTSRSIVAVAAVARACTLDLIVSPPGVGNRLL
jgi:hypothetical protein